MIEETLQPSIVELGSGLDLSSPKLIAKPGSLLEGLNYEVLDQVGYSRIEGYQRYDGNVSYTDVPDFSTILDVVSTDGAHPLSFTNTPILDDDGNIIGFAYSYASIDANTATLKYVSFNGTKVLDDVNIGAVVVSSIDNNFSESTITQDEMIALNNYLIGLVDPPRGFPRGLHWFRDTLYGVIPFQLVRYAVDLDNQATTYVAGDTLTTTHSAATAIVLGQIITNAASVSTPETGYFIVIDQSTGAWDNAVNDTETLGGAVSVGGGAVVYHQIDSDETSIEACNIWVAQRPATYALSKIFRPVGWQEPLFASATFTATVTLSGITDPFNTIMGRNTVAESTYYFESSAGNSISVILLDYHIVSGAFDTGDAVVRIQYRTPQINAGVHELEITTADDMYGESSTTTKIADVTIRSNVNYLPGYPELVRNSSRYLFKTCNFYASDDLDAFYGVSGAGRAFVYNDGYMSFIYTQDDDDLDVPRHIEAHRLHLALGYSNGSVLISVVGSPTIFDGTLGATEIATGDRITGLMELNGAVLGVFCEESVWGIVGATVDDFSLQVIAPNTGCIEYTTVDCGDIVYMNSLGIATLQTTDAYGDFKGVRLSDPVSSWLLPRCKRGTIGVANTSGVNFALPVRSKNQYRVFFNDGEILTMTFIPGDNPVAFTRQRYYFDQAATTDTHRRLVPFAWTSEIDSGGVERIYVSHKDPAGTTESDNAFALDCGSSFDGDYIPHYLVTNWYFGDAPIIYSGIQKVRLHGLSRGYAKINMFAAGIMEDYSFGENVFSTASEAINLPRTAGNIYNDLLPSTNIANLANRGLGVQLKFEGSNTDLTKPEPLHVLQVLVVYSRSGGAFDS